ncbi:MAG: tetratricopeptide repeat protein [Lamprobacter sp.]|uniref:O-linked N-acetylglucosamine transferase family protein n=1 Tax=Lamprobacter sp. TaxID=3100796 RepID=UPI002B258891|nr:tetratricopeptide repeat protein [Lamprobacter sp.]MEA3642348.1 tetratricopeptide repeat protein [Lamprobacter sp.]
MAQTRNPPTAHVLAGHNGASASVCGIAQDAAPPGHPLTTSLAAAPLNAGRQARQQGDTARAIDCFREAIRLQPDCVPAHNNLANALQADGDLEGALASARRAIELDPKRAVLHSTLGSLHWLKGDVDQAIAAYHQAIALDPTLYLAHYNLAKALAAQYQFQPAVAAYQQALQGAPDQAQAQIQLEFGQLYHRYGFMPQAIERYKAALRRAPSAPAYNALGAALQDWGNITLAQESYRRALSLKPDFDLPQYNLAQLHENLGDLAAAANFYQQALDAATAEAPAGDPCGDADAPTDRSPAHAPSHAKLRLHLEMIRRRMADWSDYDARMQGLRRAIERQLDKGQGEPLPLLSALAFDLPPDWLHRLAEQEAQRPARLAQALAPAFSYPTEPAPARLRIGYLSPDFRCHAVGTLIAGLFQHHQRPEFEIFAYSLTPVDDAWTAQVREGCDHFLDVSQQPALAIAQRIQADGIHVLIDLAGYTTHSRPLVLALRPAPVQIQWLGYPGTLGADFVPYLLADKQLIPDDQVQHYTEEVIHLPQAWGSAPLDPEPLEAAPLTDAQRRSARTEAGLPEQGLVYCCFNSLYKLEPEVFALWMTILAQVPGSVLWLIDGGANGSNQRLRQTAAAAGIDPERLIFAAKCAHADYLARYRLADLFLDTLAYNAGATGVGALAMGLPLLTCPGTHYATRMGASLCHGIGLPELIAASPEAYVEQAVALGLDAERLAQLKARLQDKLASAPLFQPQAFVASLETAYRQLWQRHVQAKPSEAAA